MFAILQMKFTEYVQKQPKDSPDDLANIDIRYLILNKISRSFSFVIQQLLDEFKDSICIFYLILHFVVLIVLKII